MAGCNEPSWRDRLNSLQKPFACHCVARPGIDRIVCELAGEFRIAEGVLPFERNHLQVSVERWRARHFSCGGVDAGGIRDSDADAASRRDAATAYVSRSRVRVWAGCAKHEASIRR